MYTWNHPYHPSPFKGTILYREIIDASLRESHYNFDFSPSAFYASLAARSIMARVSVAASAR